ncbi:MAG TPA: RNA polymerase sigma factor, partial [Verrucomicrobiae bacterium]
MKTLTDQQLLREYAVRRSEPAFAELVRRHLDLVHSAAFRMTGERQSAQDVSQAVFLTLAREAGRLAGHPVISGWLHTTARNLAANHVRAAVRRQIREKEAVSMNELSVTEPDASWAQIAPHLDAALGTLSESDRDAVVLRYFEEKSAPEIAAVLGISDDAAAKRVSRAVEKLRDILARRGIAVGASSLAVVISANAVQAAPAGLYSVVSSAVTTGIAMSGTATAAAAKSMTITAAQKVLVGAALVSGMVGLIAYLSLHPRVSATGAGIMAGQTNGALAISQTNGSTLDAQASAHSTDPDPVSLLRAVMRARMKIHSGAIEFQYSLERFDSGRKESDQRRFNTLFDGSQLRFESFGHEDAYAYDEDEVKQRDIQKRADGMSHADAVKAGLLQEFSSHHALIRDGESVYDYWDASNQRPRTDIYDLARGTGGWLFDPRCVGLT